MPHSAGRTSKPALGRTHLSQNTSLNEAGQTKQLCWKHQRLCTAGPALGPAVSHRTSSGRQPSLCHCCRGCTVGPLPLLPFVPRLCGLSLALAPCFARLRRRRRWQRRRKVVLHRGQGVCLEAGVVQDLLKPGRLLLAAASNNGSGVGGWGGSCKENRRQRDTSGQLGVAGKAVTQCPVLPPAKQLLAAPLRSARRVPFTLPHTSTLSTHPQTCLLPHFTPTPHHPTPLPSPNRRPSSGPKQGAAALTAPAPARAVA